jgi:arylsulfatase A-like enzyme
VKRAIHASGLNVPFLVRYPDRRGAGTDAPRLVSLVDLAPTVLNWAGAKVPRWIQGSSLAERRPVRYVFGATDRFDELPERRKTVIDGRFQYIRSYGNEAFLRPLRFRDQLPTMQELWRLQASGGLSPEQAQMFRALPREQLFDLRSDPHTMRDLAAEPAHAADLKRLRAAMDGWLTRSADFSAVPERQMIAGMWPGMVQPVTAAPMSKLRTGRAGSLVVLSAPTAGASIGYSLKGPNAGRWSLYTGPVPLAPGRQLWAKAIRYGYAESPVVAVAAPL